MQVTALSEKSQKNSVMTGKFRIAVAFREGGREENGMGLGGYKGSSNFVIFCKICNILFMKSKQKNGSNGNKILKFDQAEWWGHLYSTILFL